MSIIPARYGSPCLRRIPTPQPNPQSRFTYRRTSPKLRGEDEPEPAEEPERDNVIDLMSALKRSLGDAPAKPKKQSAAAKPKAKPTAKRRSA
jgi:hypothetical protein